MAVDSSSFEDWFFKAENDLKAAKGILNYYEDPPTDTICFHAHQTAEKSLKGFLISKSGSFPKSHDLVELFNLCAAHDKNLKDIGQDIAVLNKYFIEAKYPPDRPIIYSKGEAKDAIMKAEKALKSLKERIK